MKEPKIPIFRITVYISGTELVLNVGGDWHYGVRDVDKNDIIHELNKAATRHRGNIFRILTGDLTENSLKTSVGHNYDVEIADPAKQKDGAIEILTKTQKHLYGEKEWNKLATPIVPEKDGTYYNVFSALVNGNHELRTRKLTGQWLGEEIAKAGKTLWMGTEGIIELKIVNKRLKISKTYRIFVAHRPSPTNATSVESILRAFRRKQGSLPGIDIIVFGHFHKRFIQSDGYFDSIEDRFKKILYIINPSPMSRVEYAEENGYPPLEVGCYVDCFLPLDGQPYGIV